MELLILTVCFLLLAASIVGPYLIVWFLTRFQHGRDPRTYSVTVSLTGSTTVGPIPSDGRFHVPQPWVIFWLGYSQFTSLCALLYYLDPKISCLPRGVGKWFPVVFLLCGILISVCGFMAIVGLMMDDSICIVI